MSQTLKCSQCELIFPEKEIFSHMEKYHVGSSLRDNLYDITCGNCNFQVSERTASDMLQHLIRAKHNASEVTLDWAYFMRKEERRIVGILSQGVQLLEYHQDNDRGEFQSSNEQSGEMSSISILRPRKLASHQDSNIYESAVEVNGVKDESMIEEDSSRIMPLPAADILENKLGNPAEHKEENISSKAPRKPKRSGLPSPNPFRMKKKSKTAMEEPDDKSSLYAPNFYDGFNDDSQDEKSGSFGSPSTPGQIKPKKTEFSADCESCGKKIVTRTGQYRIFKQQLMYHTVSHTKQKFFRCWTCKAEMGTLSDYSTHKRTKGCPDGRISLLTDEKLAVVRSELKSCFPNFDFEFELANSCFFGNERRDFRQNSTMFAKKRVTPARKGDCHLCEISKCRNTEIMIRHACSHLGLKLYECTGCLALLSSREHINRHFRTILAQTNGCDGSYRNVATKEDLKRIRLMLAKAFPEYDWDMRLPPDTTAAGIRF